MDKKNLFMQAIGKYLLGVVIIGLLLLASRSSCIRQIETINI